MSSARARRVMIAGNWKMHHDVPASVRLASMIAVAADGVHDVDVAIAPTFTALFSVYNALIGTSVMLAAQDVHWLEQGAVTGEVSAPMLKSVGCSYCIVGHSERRQFFGETDEMVFKKIVALKSHGITPIACLGETLEEREAGQTFEVVARQLDGLLGDLGPADIATLILAYEPVWAIGTGKTASPADAQQVHAFLRDRLRARAGDAAERIRILYGGSVKPENAAGLLAQPDIDGALVGGASLDAGHFARIIQAAG